MQSQQPLVALIIAMEQCFKGGGGHHCFTRAGSSGQRKSMAVLISVPALARLAQSVQHFANRIVFVSGKSSQIERAKTEAPGQPIVTKPVNSVELEARMAEVLEAATRPR